MEGLQNQDIEMLLESNYRRAKEKLLILIFEHPEDESEQMLENVFCVMFRGKYKTTVQKNKKKYYFYEKPLKSINIRKRSLED